MSRSNVIYTENVGNGKWNVEEGIDEGLSLPGERKSYTITVHDARGKPSSIHKEGFQLLSAPTKVNNFYNDEEIKQVYYPEVTELVKRQIPEAKRIHIFDHTRRISSREEGIKKEGEAPVRPVASITHNDYTAASGLNRVKQLFPEEGDELLKKYRVVIVNVWRGIKKVESFPLAFVNALTTAPEDFLTLYRIEKDRVGEIQQVKYNPKHEWNYYSKMDVDEAVIFKTFDSTVASGYIVHSAVDLTDDRNNIPTRESIEIRVLVLLDKQPKARM